MLPANSVNANDHNQNNGITNDMGHEKQQPVPPSSEQGKSVRSSLVSRNVTIHGKRTSIRLEPDMWNGLQDICRREYTSMHDLCSAVAERKARNTSLTAAIRVFVMAYFRAACTEDGHSKAGQGPGGVFLTNWQQQALVARQDKFRALPSRRLRKSGV